MENKTQNPNETVQNEVPVQPAEEQPKAAKKQLPPAVVLCIIAVVAALALALTNQVTKGPIAELKQKALNEAYQAVMPAASYEEITMTEPGSVTGLYAAKDENGTVIGYTVTAKNNGYGGGVAVNYGLDLDGVVRGVVVGDSDFSETPGFGKRWQDESVYSRLIGLDALNGGSFEALSGATLTSNAILANTQDALEAVALYGLLADAGEILFGKAAPVEAAQGGAPAGEPETAEAPGFNGDPVTVTVEKAADGTIATLTVDASTQLQGIGKACEDPAFTNQFIGQKGPFELGNGIDAASGATFTSQGVVDAVNSLFAAAGAEYTTEAPGFNGDPVKVTVAVAEDGTVSAVTVDASTQLQGIGLICEDPAFTSQFVGKTGPFTLGDGIDAASGATFTSQGVVDAVNAALKQAAEGVNAVTEITANDELSVGVNGAGALVITGKDGYTGTTNVNVTMENGKATGAEIGAAPAAAPEAPAAADGTAEAPGFNGDPVKVTITKNDDGTIATIKVDASSQMAGIGLVCESETFTNQFVGKAGPFTLGKDIDACSGATYTSTAVVEAVNSFYADAAPAAAEEPAPAGDTAEAPGFNGDPVKVTVTKNADGTIATLKVDASSQLAGIGLACEDASFTDQFIGKAGPFTLGDGIDAASGATYTSTAVVEAVNSFYADAAPAAAEEPAPAGDTAEAPGFNGDPVKVTVTKNADGTIATLKVDASTQLAGIGLACEDASFTDQFIGKAGPFTLGDGIDAASGATYTSTAVVNAVNSFYADAAPAAAEEPAPAGDTAEAPGFNGDPVKVTVTKNADGTIATLKVDASSQLAGIGLACEDASFTDQFIGKAGPFTLGDGIDAASGATYTSTAVVEAVNSFYADAAPAAAEEPAPAGDTAEAPGFNGDPVKVTITKNADGTIATLKVDASSQLAGIGLACEDASFTDQFIGKAGPFTLGDGIDAASGATYTSTAVVNAVNSFYEDAAPAPAVEEPAPYDGTVEVPGYAGDPVKVTVTKNEDGTIATLTVDASSQKAGIGLACEDASFTDQFVGKAGPFTLRKNIDIASGATWTSKAVVDAVNLFYADAEPAAEEVAPAAEEPAPAAEEPAPAQEPVPAVAEPAADDPNALTAEAAGYAGDPVKVTITRNEDGTIAAIKVDASTQLAGIGKACEDAAFTSQFIGKAGPFVLREGIDIASGATWTSKAVVEALNSLYTK